MKRKKEQKTSIEGELTLHMVTKNSLKDNFDFLFITFCLLLMFEWLCKWVNIYKEDEGLGYQEVEVS